MNPNIVFVGMDLGTFKTSVASSTGARCELHTAVGWPKDHLAQERFGSDVVFGKELIEHRLALDIVRPFEKGVLKYNSAEDCGFRPADMKKHREAARLLVNHAVASTRPTKGMPVYGVIGAPSKASIANKQVIREAAQGAFDAVVIVPEPFTIAYSMSRQTDSLVVDIGAGTIDLCPVYGSFPSKEEQVTIPIGGDFIDEFFMEGLRVLHPEAQFRATSPRSKRNMALCTRPTKGLSCHCRLMACLPTWMSRPPLKEACQTIVEPIVKGLRELIRRFDPEFQERMLQNIVLGGGGSQLRGLDRVIEQSMTRYGNVKVRRVNDPVFAGAVGALKLAMGMPDDKWQCIEEVQQAAKVAVA